MYIYKPEHAGFLQDFDYSEIIPIGDEEIDIEDIDNSLKDMTVRPLYELRTHAYSPFGVGHLPVHCN
jgi:hypothetical protein